MSGTPLLSSVHDMLTWKNYPHDRQLIAVSEAVKGHLLARGFDAGRIKVVPRCPDCSFGATGPPVRQPAGLWASRPTSGPCS
jgi:hypothetical protein